MDYGEKILHGAFISTSGILRVLPFAGMLNTLVMVSNFDFALKGQKPPN